MIYLMWGFGHEKSHWLECKQWQILGQVDELKIFEEFFISQGCLLSYAK